MSKSSSANGDIIVDKNNTNQFEDVHALIVAAEQANSDALFAIGLMYYYGSDTTALQAIGKHFYNEKTIKKDISLAFEWFSDAANLGHVQAAYCAGALIQDRNGNEVHASVKDAKKYLRIAAKSGYSLAAERLMYPIPKDKLKEIPTNVKGKHTLSFEAFNRLRKPWLWLMLLPSLLLDVVIVIISLHDVLGGFESFLTVLTNTVVAFIINALLLKMIVCHYYTRLRDIRAECFVMTSGRYITYVRYNLCLKKIAGESDAIQQYSEFKITSVEELSVQKNGTIMVRGEIEETQLFDNSDDTQKERLGAKSKKKLIIPGYYVDMQIILEKLQKTTLNKK